MSEISVTPGTPLGTSLVECLAESSETDSLAAKLGVVYGSRLRGC